MTLPSEMNCVVLDGFGGPEVLKPGKRPMPAVGADDVLIKVAAAGVNRPDVLQRTGFYTPPPGASDLPGLEVAGTIAAVGSSVQDWKIGDPVMALVSGGGYAEYCAAPAPQCLPVPKGFSMIEAAAVPETFFTVWTNVFERGRLQKGEIFLVHGGSSGIGTTAIQLAHLFGATVITTVGGDNINRYLACLAMDGRLVQSAFLLVSKADINLSHVMMKRQTITGSTLRPRSVAQKGEIAAALQQNVLPLFEAGKAKPVIYKTLKLAEAAEAHRLMESSAHIGKIVLTV